MSGKKIVIKDRKSGQVLATGIEDQNVFRFENNWYFDPEAVRQDLLTLTEAIYICSYKGTALWFDVAPSLGQARRVAWIYQEPVPDYRLIRGKIGFYPGLSATTEAIVEEAASQPKA